MKAVILAAGEGSRMRLLTYTRPKVMLPIANKPILEHLLVEVAGAGIREFVLIVGYHDEQVRDYFGSGEKWGVKIDYLTQRQRLGTADAIKRLEGVVNGNFLVLNGDIIASKEDILSLVDKKNNTIGVIEVEDVTALGVVEVSDGRVTSIYEKTTSPPSNLANAGMYVFTPEIFDAIARTQKSPRGEYEITESLKLIIDGGQTVAYHELGYWLDCSYPWDLLLAYYAAKERGCPIDFPRNLAKSVTVE